MKKTWGIPTQKAMILIVIVFFLVCTYALPAKSLGQTTVISSTITVGNNPNGVIYDSAKGEIFVANSDSNSVSVISDTNNKVLATVCVGSYPWGLAYDSVKGEIFVSNWRDSTVSIISDETNTVIANVTVGSNPSFMVYDSGKGEIFVACHKNLVSIISDNTNSQIATVPVGNLPQGMTYDSSTGEVYVTNTGDNTVSVISDSTNSVITTVNMVPEPNLDSSLSQAYAAVYDSANGKIYVTMAYTNRVATISDSTHTVIENISFASSPYGIAYNSGPRQIFVLCSKSTGPDQSSSTLSIISDTNNGLVENVDLGQSWASAMVYDFGKNEVFLTTSPNTVIILSLSSKTYPSPSQIPEIPAIAILPLLLSLFSVALIVRHRKTAKLGK